MKQTARVVLFLMISMACFSACDPGRAFDRYQKIEASSWHKDFPVTFHVPATDTIQNHHLLIQIRHETSYEYSNLWLFIEITQPGGKVMRDTFEIAMAEPSGRWLGTGLGNLKTRQANYKKNFRFPVSGEYTVSLQHGMREETLQGIHDVGIRIEKAE